VRAISDAGQICRMGGVHEYLIAQRNLARFAHGVYVASEEHSERVLAFLASLQDNVALPESVRNEAVDVCDAVKLI
jgi:hypothetical protein